MIFFSLQRRHNGCNGIWNHQPHYCLLNRLFWRSIDQRKHLSSTSLAFVRGIHQWPVNSPHKWPVTRKMFPFDDVIMSNFCAISVLRNVRKCNTWLFPKDKFIMTGVNFANIIIFTKSNKINLHYYSMFSDIFHNLALKTAQTLVNNNFKMFGMKMTRIQPWLILCDKYLSQNGDILSCVFLRTYNHKYYSITHHKSQFTVMNSLGVAGRKILLFN